MKKKLAVMASAVLLYCVIAAPGVFAAVADMGAVYYTDIKATINGSPVPYISVSVNGNAGVGTVAVTDLTNYGFDVAVNDSAKTATITFNPNKATTPLPVVEATGKPGNVAYRYFSTDWKVYVAGSSVPCYNVASRLSIKFGDLAAFGSYAWNGGARVSAFTTSVASNPNPPPASSYTVSGRVTDQSTGAVISGATVSLYVNGVIAQQKLSDNNGNFSFTGVAPGSNCNIEVGYPAMGYGTSKSAGFTVSANVTGLAAALQKTVNASLTGYVTSSANNAAISGASLTLKNSAGTTVGTATTDAYGAYTITGVAAGSYSLNVTAAGYGSNAVSVTLSGVALRQDVKLSRTGYAINGTVNLGYASVGANVNNIQIKLYINGINASNVVDTTYTNSSGVFTFSGLANGVYYAVATASQYGYFGDSSSGQIIINNNDATARIILQAGGATLTGQVLVPSGVYLDGSTVIAAAYDYNNGNPVRLSGDINVTIPNRVGNVSVTSDKFGVPVYQFSGSKSVFVQITYRYRLSNSGNYTQATAQSQNVLMSGNQNYSTDVGTITLDQSLVYTVSGTINGIPAGRNATIYLDNNNYYNSTQNYSVTVYNNGSYMISGVPNGNYTLYAVMNDSSLLQTDTLPVQVTNNDVSGKNLTFATQTVTVTGTVVDALGTKLANVDVGIMGNGFSTVVKTDGQGVYRIPNVPASTTGVAINYALTFALNNLTKSSTVSVNTTNVTVQPFTLS
ncbi:MAG: carboxypeptidase regulatory-like domain-containing protein [Firmicutes bacterium]|nr:carboxypeptidase regulatory-like domain-containing protein [Bacillota bacterium]